jgi:hypothetical protein
MHICLSDLIEKEGIRQSCRLCRIQYYKKYREDGRYDVVRKERWDKLKHSPMAKAKAKINSRIQYSGMKRAAEFLCVDCGDKASVYDHRDYNKPYEVDPVCRKCNLKRGPGLNKYTVGV